MNENKIIPSSTILKYRYFMEIAYEGTNYCGWQRQLNVPTVQQVLEDLLSKIFHVKITVMGCGRTDSGVHASQYFAHINVPEKKDYLMKALRGSLPGDIIVKRVIEVADDAHARFDATERSYIYKLHSERDPFLRNYSLLHPLRKLNTANINAACRLFEKYNNYEQLCKLNPDIKEHTSNVESADWIELNEGKNVEFRVKANRYLHNQIRRMVGCLLDIGNDKISLQQLEDALKNNVPLPYNNKVAPHGLYLSNIKYPFIPE